MNDALRTLHAALENLLAEWKSEGTLSTYIVNLTSQREHTSVLFKGLRHTKAPEQGSTRTEITAYLETPSGRCVEAMMITGSFSLARERLREALTVAAPLSHKPSVKKHARYPAVPLASEELLAVFARGEAAATAARLAQQTDAFAAGVSHERLMSREVHATLSHSERRYFDSTGNTASEEAASVSLQCTFWLTDTSEDASDAVGTLPDEAFVKHLVNEAARNLAQTEVRKLVPREGSLVALTPKAFLSLLEDLVFPNLQARTILRKTGAFEVAHIGTRVLERLTLRDDPHKPYSPFSGCYDTEGTPTAPVTVVENGTLAHPLFTASLLAELEADHAQFAGRFSLTGHASGLDSASHTNCEVSLENVETTTLEATIASAPQVVVVSNLTGMSADPLTGQFALDADGAKVFENGVLAYSTSLTLRGNIMEVLRDERALALPRERAFNRWAPGVVTGTLSCVAKELVED